MKARRLKAGRVSRAIKRVAGFAAATVLVAGLAFSCKPKEQPKKPVPVVKCKPCEKPKPCSSIDHSKLTYLVSTTRIQKGAPIILTHQDHLFAAAAKARKNNERVFTPKSAFLIIGSISKIDKKGIELTLDTKIPRKVRLGYDTPQCVPVGPITLAMYVQHVGTENILGFLKIRYPREMFPKK